MKLSPGEMRALRLLAAATPTEPRASIRGVSSNMLKRLVEIGVADAVAHLRNGAVGYMANDDGWRELGEGRIPVREP
jgi:hypothetical protein